MKKILITGVAGFIGYHLHNKLIRKGHSVIGVDNFDHPCGAPIQCVKGDILNRSLMDELIAGCDIVYHLAAQIHVDRSYVERQLTFDVNVEGTKIILELCTKHNSKVVFPSSVEVYGTSQEESMSEEHRIHPQNPYAESKWEAEKLCAHFSGRYGTNVSVLRNFNTYGPFQNNGQYGSVIPIFVRRISDGLPPIITGDGKQTRDFMYIDDTLKGYELMTLYDTCDPVNIGTGTDVSINELARKILSIMNSDLSLEYTDPRPNEIMKIRGNISKAKKLGFYPTTTLRDGLKKYISWYDKIHQINQRTND